MLSMTRSKFLENYKELEKTLALIGTDVLNYENIFTNSEDSNKLKLCRMTRNYLQHNNDQNFVEPTDKMIKFLENLNKSLLAKTETNAKKMVKTDKIKIDINDRLDEVLPILAKYKLLLIYDKNTFKGVYRTSTYLNFALKNKITKTTKVSTFEKPGKVYVAKNAQYSISLDLLANNPVVFVTETGKEKEEILGVLINELL